MTILKEIYWLLQKEIVLEWRQKYAISGILLYVLSTVFIVFIASVNPKREVWNSLFWIIVLFASVNAVTKSFVQENGNRQLYYYSLVNPIAILLSKVIYNTLLLLLLSFLSWAAFSFVSGDQVKDTGQFFAALFLGSTGFSVTFTFISAIASKAKNSATLMAVLGFPLIIPVLLSLLKISANALRLMNDTNVAADMWTLVAIDFALLGMGILLFPFLWRD
jgi:heme exporter protein B